MVFSECLKIIQLMQSHWMYDNSTFCKQTENTLDYSKGLRYTFWGELKNSCSSNSCNLSYLIRQKQNHQKIMQLKFFTINSCISNIFGPYSKMCIVKVCAAWSCVSRGLTVFKGGFFSESAMWFSNLKKKYSKKTNLNFPPTTVKCFWREI